MIPLASGIEPKLIFVVVAAIVGVNCGYCMRAAAALKR